MGQQTDMTFIEAMKKLKELLHTKTKVRVKDIPHEFIKDLNEFMVGQGRTTSPEGDELIFHRDFKKWYARMIYKGIDYAIQFKKFK